MGGHQSSIPGFHCVFTAYESPLTGGVTGRVLPSGRVRSKICPDKAVPGVADSCSSLKISRLDHVIYTEIMYCTLKLGVYQTAVKTLPNPKLGGAMLPLILGMQPLLNQSMARF